MPQIALLSQETIDKILKDLIKLRQEKSSNDQARW